MDKQFYPRRLAENKYQLFKRKFSGRTDETSLTKVAREGNLEDFRLLCNALDRCRFDEDETSPFSYKQLVLRVSLSSYI